MHHTTTSRRALGLALTVALAAAACGSDDDTASENPADDTAAADATAAPTTDSAVPETTAPATTEPPPTSEAPGADCPAPEPWTSIEPVDPDIAPIPEFVPTIAAGRYRTELPGVALAVDLPAGPTPFFDVAQMLLETPNGLVRIRRAAEGEFVTTIPAPDEEPETVDFDTWLTESDVQVVSDEETTVAGRPAREVTIAFAPPVRDADGNQVEVPFLVDGRLLASESPQRIIVVDVEHPESLLIEASGFPATDPSVFDAEVDAIVQTLEIGAAGPSPAAFFVETPWNAGGPVRYADVAGGCVVETTGFGGARFTLSDDTRVAGGGDAVSVASSDLPFTGVAPPQMSIFRPAVAGADLAPITTVGDAVGAAEAGGLVLTPIESDAVLAGAPVTAFSFTTDTEFPDPWRVARSETSVDWLGLPPFPIVGELVIAETDAGVIVADLWGDAGTDDIELLRDRFDVMVATFEFTG